MNDPKSEVIRKALTDAAFKAELMKNPKAAVEKTFGIKLPAGASIKVVEDTAATVHLVLPAAPSKGSRALSDAELETASGGADAPKTFVILPGCQSTGLCPM